MPISFAVKTNPPPEPQVGLYKLVENDPINSTMTLEMPALIDGDRITKAHTQNWNKNYSFGFDLGSPAELAGIDIYCETTYGTPTAWYQPGSGWGIVGLYKSDDNITWSLIEEQIEPPSIGPALERWNFRCTFPSPQTARYFKVRCNCVTRSYFAVEGGSLIQIAELELLLP